MRILQGKNLELKKEIEKLQDQLKNSGQSVDNQSNMSQNQMFGKLFNSLMRTKNIIQAATDENEEMEDIKANQQ